MLEMNEIIEENGENEKIEKRDIKIKDKIYNIKFYIDGNKLVVEIEKGESKFSNKYELEKLKEFELLLNPKTLQDAIEEIKDLLDKQFSIEEKGKNLELIFPHRRHPINFMLNQIDDNIDISYDNLSPEMKKIIDNNELVLGIDLGTTYSCASVMIDKNIIIIRNSLGSTTIPSFIAFLSKTEAYVGQLSKLLPSNSKNIIYNTKRLIGENIQQKEIQEFVKSLSFKIKNEEETNLLQIELNFNEDEDKGINFVNNKKKKKKTEEEIAKEESEKQYFYPEQICALIIKKIIEDSEFYLFKKIGKLTKIKNCVLTVPAYFNQKQREATLNSAKIIGLNVKTMINEPTAASLAYGLNSKGNSEKKIIVIDFGGGTLDITLLKYIKDKNGIYCNVLETYGDTNFGGEDFDKILMAKCKEKFLENKKNTNTLIYKEKLNSVRLKRACERAKIKLSSLEETKIHLENYVQYERFDFSLKKEEFIEYCKDLFDKFENILNDFLKKSNTDEKNIDEVILIGGSTFIPRIKDIITNKFNKSKINCNLNPKEVVAMGAAIRGAISLNLLSVQEIQLFDVTNLSFGLKIKNDEFHKIINRSTKLPCEKIARYKTVVDNQESVLVEIYEGEGELKCNENNLLLGQFRVTGLPHKKAGDVKILVKIRINENSILEVTAWEKDNEVNKNQIKIEKLCKLDLDWLSHQISGIYFNENKEYDNIKFEVIELEEEIDKQKTQKKLNDEAIKLLNKNLLEKLGKFLIITKDKSNLYISFIKYYFNKICEYFQYYNEKCNDDINDFNNIKENIKHIFDKVQFMNSELLFEIIEEFVDHDNLYKSFIDYILQRNFEKINELFFNSSSAKKEKKSNLIEKALKELFEANKLADICIGLLNKFDLNINNSSKLNIKDLENMKLKIKVREEIIKENNTSFIMKIFSSNKENLTNLFNQYYTCEAHDKDDLQELKTLIGREESKVNDEKIEENFDEEFQKASSFNEWIISQINNLEGKTLSNTITRILNDYPYCEKDGEGDMWDNFDLYKSYQIESDKYILMIRGKYQKLLNDDKTNDVKKQVYENILMFLNTIK